ncbi:hypothetical protein [Clostridium felsineum]|uniref:Uncharacterized protein n=1 Tax=Clostridium felsineum TaxID=36839 RepID=A0A1S8L515_9CLOT|nr:hypothetical protein [Clostridium felsineum]URZ05797.1 hypothetical protein CLROS_011280 [Clostridium felsineum]URZ10836.1 hypothetical protein CROST_015510 [Clostridium felsineum]
MKHIVVEANCFYDINKKEGEKVPKCCEFGANNISNNCLEFDGTSNKYCPFLVFGSAKTTLVLTEQKGNVINSNSFWADLSLSEEEWKKREKEWLEDKNKLINGLNED